jgi:hypothetical protein
VDPLRLVPSPGSRPELAQASRLPCGSESGGPRRDRAEPGKEKNRPGEHARGLVHPPDAGSSGGGRRVIGIHRAARSHARFAQHAAGEVGRNPDTELIPTAVRRPKTLGFPVPEPSPLSFFRASARLDLHALHV